MIEIREGGLDHPAVRTLLDEHVRFGRAHTPAANAHVLEKSALLAPAITFWSAWDGEALAGFVALKVLADVDGLSGEVKSMRTAVAHQRRGIARALLDRVIATARARGYRRLSLETGTAPAFGPANRLYETTGFVDAPAFGGYPESLHNRFLTMILTDRP